MADYIGTTLSLVVIAVAVIIGIVVFANISSGVDITTAMTPVLNGSGDIRNYTDTWRFNNSFLTLQNNANTGFKLLAVGLIVLAAGAILAILLTLGDINRGGM